MNGRLASALGIALFTLASAEPVFARSRSAASQSSTGFLWLVGIAVVIFVGAIIGLMYYLDRRRSDKIQAIATRLGFTFRRTPTDADNALIAGCQIANAGHSRITSNVLEAAQTDELKIALFDYSYTIGYGKSSQQFNQTVTRMQSPVLQLPAFTLYPETVFSKLKKLFGGADINFPESPGFSKKYILRGADEGAIRALFTPELRQFLEQQSQLTVDAGGDTLFVHRSGRRAKPEQIESYLAEAKQTLATFFEAQNSQRPATPPPLPPPMPQ